LAAVQSSLQNGYHLFQNKKKGFEMKMGELKKMIKNLPDDADVQFQTANSPYIELLYSVEDVKGKVVLFNLMER
jgi:hypothetical protein